MKTKNEIIKKLALMQKQMNDLEETINAMPDEPKTVEKWEPKAGDWFVSGDGNVSRQNTREDFARFGTEYQTKEAAEKARDAMRAHNRLLAWLSENDDGWVADWGDTSNIKYYVFYKHQTNKWDILSNSGYRTPGIVYMSHENAKKLCKLLNDGTIKL